jgi:hypothetical protein
MSTAIQPFRISVGDDVLDDLKSRLRNTRWPEAELVDDWSQGAPLKWINEICRYWADGYDWRSREARLNRFAQFTTGIDGLGIHFLHVRSPHANAMPLIITHGWPGSIVEFHKVIEPLADPAAYGGDAADAFHVVCPSLPGFGFSAKPMTTGWGVDRIASAWAVLMDRLGYARYGAQGGDWGSAVTTALGAQDETHCAGIHVTLAMSTRPNVEGQPTPERRGRSMASSITPIGIRATPNSNRPGRRRLAMGSRIHQAARPRGSWKNSGPGPIVTGIPKTFFPVTNCLITSCCIGCLQRPPRRRVCIGKVLGRSGGPRTRSDGCRRLSQGDRHAGAAVDGGELQQHPALE